MDAYSQSIPYPKWISNHIQVFWLRRFRIVQQSTYLLKQCWTPLLRKCIRKGRKKLRARCFLG